MASNPTYEELLQANQKLSVQLEETKDEFQKKENLFQVIFDTSPDVINISRVEDGVFVAVNQSFSELTGYSKDEVLGRTVYEINLWGDTTDRDRLTAELKKNGVVKNFEAQYRLKDGSVAVGLMSAIIINLDDVPHILAVTRDISHIKETESALKKSEALYRTLFENINLGVTLIDSEHNIVMANSAQSRMFKKKPGYFIGKKCFKEFERRDSQCDHCPGISAMNTGLPQETESTGVMDDGSKFDVRILAFPVFGADNKPEGFIEIVEDITDSKRLEKELQKSQKLEAIGILAGGIAHDFNNLLTAILGNISLAKLRIDRPEKVAELLTGAEKAASRASDLTTQLLTFSKGGAPILRPASAIDIIKESIGFSFRGSACQSEYTFPEDLWPVKADVGQLSQVIQNIAINAMQAMPEGGIVTIKAENKIVSKFDNLALAEGKYIKISITDAGVGISEKILPKIFDPYFTTKQSGSGLGLATCYSIIEQHNGLITAYSERGMGASFNVYIPASPKTIEQKSRDASKPLVAEGKILIMDDEEYVRTTLAKILEHFGFEVDHAKDGQEAIDAYQKSLIGGKPYVAVILDLTIPGGMGGKETIKALKEIDPEIKAIVSSGYANDPIMATHSQYGFKGVVVKPYHVDDLQSALQYALSI